MPSGHPSLRIRSVAIDALGNALEFRHFSRMDDTTIGGKRDAQKDWRPKSNREALDYWRECFLILRSIILSGGKDAEIAKASLGKNIGVILQTPLLLELDGEFKELSETMSQFWPEVKDKIKTILSVNKRLAEPQRSALERWEAYLTPADNALEATLMDSVVKPGWHQRKEEDGSFTDLSREEAERVASKLAANRVDLVRLLPQLLKGEQQQTFSFGAVLGKVHPDARRLIDATLELWPSLDRKERNPSLIRGIMRGLGSESALVTAILDRVARDDRLIDLLLPLTTSLERLGETDFLRIRDAVIESRLEPSELRNLIPGKPLSCLSDEFLIEQCAAIVRAKPESAQVLLEVLSLHCHGESTKFERFSALFRVLLLADGLALDDSHFGWEWHEVALKLISTTGDRVWLRSVARHICDEVIASRIDAGSDFLSVVVTKLFEKAPRETWVPFGVALRQGDEFQRHVIAEFLGKSGSSFDDTGSPLWSLPEQMFREWAQTNRDFVPLALEKISLYVVEKQEDGSERFTWHPHALILLDEGTNDEELEHALFDNLFCFGSTGSKIPYLERRIALVQDLVRTNDPRLMRIARTVGGWLEEEKQRTKREELNEAARFQ